MGPHGPPQGEDTAHAPGPTLAGLLQAQSRETPRGPQPLPQETNAQKNHLNLSLMTSVVEFPPFYRIICLIVSLYHVSFPRPLAA